MNSCNICDKIKCQMLQRIDLDLNPAISKAPHWYNLEKNEMM